jgi:hypothetical protein
MRYLIPMSCCIFQYNGGARHSRSRSSSSLRHAFADALIVGIRAFFAAILRTHLPRCIARSKVGYEQNSKGQTKIHLVASREKVRTCTSRKQWVAQRCDPGFPILAQFFREQFRVQELNATVGHDQVLE